MYMTCFLLLVFTAFFFEMGCKKSDGAKVEKIPLAPAQSEYKILINGKPLWVEVADSEEERSHGLMFRKQLGANQGMLFVFDSPRPLSFWMKNTYIPLDIAFVNEAGVIISIQQMKPLDEIPQYTSPAPAKYAIETSEHWFKQNQIEVGMKISF